jgi:hypothetical protein
MCVHFYKKKVNVMAAAAIIAIRKNGGNTAADTGEKIEFSELTERLPPAESREVDIEIGMLLIGYNSFALSCA